MRKYGQVPVATDGEKKEYNIVSDNEKIFGKSVTEMDHLEAQERADISRLIEIAQKTNDREVAFMAIARFFELTGEKIENLDELSRML